MAEDVEELVVRATPEGIDETNEQLDQMSGKFDRTAEEMQETTGLLGDLERRFSGVMGALVAGFAVATGGLLTQVPVLSEVMSGLGSIFNVLGFQIDKALRPALGGLTEDLFEISQDAAEAEGALEALDEVVSGIGELTLDQISLAVEGDAIGVAGEDILTFVFPKLGKEDLLTAIFSFDMSAAAVLAIIFGGITMTAGKILAVIFGGVTMTAGAILAVIFGGIALTGGAISSALFDDVSFTEGTITSAIFGGLTIGVSALLGTISWPVVAGSAIVGAIIWPVISQRDVLNKLLPGGKIPETIPSGPAIPGRTGTRNDPTAGAPGALPESEFPAPSSGNTTATPEVSPSVLLDGQTLNEQQSQYNDNYTRNGGR